MKLLIIALASALALSYTEAVAQSGSSTMPTGVRESGTKAAEPMNGRTTTTGATGPTMMNGATTTTADDVKNKASSEGSARKKDSVAPDGTLKK